MYEWVPFLHGSYYTYTEYAAGISFAVFLVLGLLNYLVAFLLGLCTKADHTEVPRHLYEADGKNLLLQPSQARSDYNQRLYNGSHSLDYLEQQLEESSISSCLISFFQWTGTFFIALAPVGFSFFGVLISPWISAILMFLHFFFKVRSGYHSKTKKLFNGLRHVNTVAYAQELTSARSSYRWKLFFFLALSFVSSFSLTGGCIAFYEDYVGLRLDFVDLSVSTKLSRYFQLSDSCPKGRPCHVYATLPEDASTGVFINVHTHVDHENIVVQYDTKDYYEANHNLRYSQTFSTIKMDYLEQRGRRSVHTALLDGLEPETRYYAQIVYDGGVQNAFDYVTLPGQDSQKDIIISTGGDLGDRTIAKQITMQAGSVDPDVIVIGGDVAYDDGEHTCYFTWDNFFRSFALSTLTSGRLVPFLFSIGNHDVGLNPLSGRNLDITNKGPLYMVFLPQHTVPGFDSHQQPINKVPDLNERLSYHYHIFSNIIHMNLDTGYLASVENQTEFITTLSTAFPSHIKMVSHHNPIYKACEGSRDQVEQDANDLWIPLFDKFRFMAIFENHEHSFKKTFQLTGGKITDNGIYYLGNGNWGAKPSTPTCSPNNATGVLEYSSRINHYWLVNVSVANGVVQYTPYNSAGVPLIPTFEQEIDQYVN